MVAAAVIAIVAGVASAAVGAVGAYQSGKAAQAQASWNQKVASNSAMEARQQGEFQAQQVRLRGLKLIGTSQAAAGRSGVTLGGSVNDVMYDSSLQNEMDQMTSRYKGEVVATRDINQGNADAFEGSMAESNAQFSMAGSIISGAGSVARSGYSLYAYEKNPSLN